MTSTRHRMKARASRGGLPFEAPRPSDQNNGQEREEEENASPRAPTRDGSSHPAARESRPRASRPVYHSNSQDKRSRTNIQNTMRKLFPTTRRLAALVTRRAAKVNLTRLILLCGLVRFGLLDRLAQNCGVLVELVLARHIRVRPATVFVPKRRYVDRRN